MGSTRRFFSLRLWSACRIGATIRFNCGKKLKARHVVRARLHTVATPCDERTKRLFQTGKPLVEGPQQIDQQQIPREFEDCFPGMVGPAAARLRARWARSKKDHAQRVNGDPLPRDGAGFAQFSGAEFDSPADEKTNRDASQKRHGPTPTQRVQRQWNKVACPASDESLFRWLPQFSTNATKG